MLRIQTQFIRGKSKIPNKSGFMLDGAGAKLSGSYNDLRGHSKSYFRGGFGWTVVQKKEHLSELARFDRNKVVVFTYDPTPESLALVAVHSLCAVIVPNGTQIDFVAEYTRPKGGIPQVWSSLTILCDGALVRHLSPDKYNHCDRTRSLYAAPAQAEPPQQDPIPAPAENNNAENTGEE